MAGMKYSKMVTAPYVEAISNCALEIQSEQAP